MFPETEWTQIRAAVTAGGSVDPSRIESLCESYYGPISGFLAKICGRGDDAEDIAQEFMADLARGKYLIDADPDAGRLRCFLCQCARNYARSVWRRRGAAKRGGDVEQVPLESVTLEGDAEDAVAQFDRDWANRVVERALQSLEKQLAERMPAGRFALLMEGLGWSGGARASAELAGIAEMSPGAFATAVHRFKGRFLERLREEVRLTVTSHEDVEDELRYYVGLYGVDV